MSKPIPALTVQTLKPRNPLVKAALFRRAGPHRAGGALPQHARLQLERGLDPLRIHVP
jgi:hypothetical protein